MNIFVLDYDPVKAAKAQCDKHVVKMPLETAQLLCSVFPKGSAPYKRTHYNHPCSLWCRYSKENYNWLILHGLALCEEYTFRYHRVHKSQGVIEWCLENISKLEFKQESKSRFTLCFDEKYKVGNAVDSYRAYYKDAKKLIAKWNQSRPAPAWF